MAMHAHLEPAASQPQPSPVRFFQAMNSFHDTAALKAAVELDVFTAIGAGQQTAEAIARQCSASERGTRILCDYLVTMGFLQKRQQRYTLGPDGIFLDRKSPAYVGAAVKFLTSPLLREGFDRLTESVRNGGTVLDHGGGSLVPENPVWVEFGRSMAPLMRVMAEETVGVQQARKVLDIAAGHGMYGIAVAKRSPAAEITVLDWPNVLEVARENARAAGIEKRFHEIRGSAFEVDFGHGYDLVLVPNFLHHFDPPTNESLLRKVHAEAWPLSP